MRLAVLADIHDNIWNLEKALSRLNNEAEALLCLGDFCAPFSLKQLIDGFAGPLHCVPGNNDGDMFLLLRVANQAGRVTFYQPMGSLEFAGRKIAITHYPEVAAGLVALGRYDVVFSGHTHVYFQQPGATLWVNPGEIMGRFGEPGFVVYETETNRCERVLL